jgi:hypothetical protein
MRFLGQVLIVILVLAATTFAISGMVRHWSEWVLWGALLLSVVSVSLAVWHPRYPRGKRTIRRDSSSRW